MKVLLSTSALDLIRHEAANVTAGLETGGILLGHCDPLSVSRAGEPGPGAVRTKSFFLRDLEFSQGFAAREEASSGAKWIGEWHTHPGGPPHPSPTDLATYARLQGNPESPLSAGVLSLIVVRHEAGFAMTAWWCVNGHGSQMLMEER